MKLINQREIAIQNKNKIVSERRDITINRNAKDPKRVL